MAEEIYLQVERPGMHIGVKIWQVGIISYRFKVCAPAEPRTNPLCKRGFSRPNVSGHDYQSFRHTASSIFTIVHEVYFGALNISNITMVLLIILSKCGPDIDFQEDRLFKSARVYLLILGTHLIALNNPQIRTAT
jgi:hypothetical protein